MGPFQTYDNTREVSYIPYYTQTHGKKGQTSHSVKIEPVLKPSGKMLGFYNFPYLKKIRARNLPKEVHTQKSRTKAQHKPEGVQVC